MSEETFQYEALEPQQIRILKIEPHPDSATVIRCTHSIVSLDNVITSYIAVSYTWGSEQLSHQILLDGHPLYITQNVHDILSSRRMTETGLPMWIDGICINQHDIEEKARQVQLMGKVYSKADHVRIWLGHAGEYSEVAINFAKTLALALKHMGPTGELVEQYAAQYPEGCTEWVSLALFLERDWFKRTWVIQEAALSKRTEMICGDDTLSLETLSKLVVKMDMLGFLGMVSTAILKYTNAAVAPAGCRRVFHLSNIQDLLESGEPLPIVTLMVKFADSESKDPRDKVYSLLGIATDAHDPVFQPDYNKSPIALIKEVTRYLINRDNDLSLLRHSGNSSSNEIPSWCLNLKRDSWRSKFGKYAITPTKNMEFSFDADLLTIKGILFDQIAEMGRICSALIPGHTNTEEEIWDIWEWYLQAKKLFQSTSHPEEEFWRTLNGNKTLGEEYRWSDGSPDAAYAGYHAAFESIFAKVAAAGGSKEANEYVLSEEGHKAMAYRRNFMAACGMRRFSILKGGQLGLMPTEARPGDLIVAFLGVTVLFVVRPLDNETGEQRYHLIGECYVHNRMDGQVLDLGIETVDIVLK